MIGNKKFESRASLFATRQEKRWHFFCKSNGVPFVTIRYKREFADVIWDAATLSRERYDKLRADSFGMRYEILSRCERFRHRKFSFEYDTKGGRFRNVRLGEAEIPASILFDFILRGTEPSAVPDMKAEAAH